MARKPVTTPIDPTTVDLTVPTRDESRPSDLLRPLARAIYVANADGITLEELAADPRFSGVISLTTLKRWAADDGWVAERTAALEKFGDKIKDKLARDLYSRIANVRIQQLSTVAELKADLLKKAAKAEVKSAEGAAKAALDLMKWELELSQNIAQELSPQGGGSSIDPRSDVTDAEVVEAARIVLRQRRERARGVIVETTAVPAPKLLPEGSGGT